MVVLKYIGIAFALVILYLMFGLSISGILGSSVAGSIIVNVLMVLLILLSMPYLLRRDATAPRISFILWVALFASLVVLWFVTQVMATGYYLWFGDDSFDVYQDIALEGGFLYYVLVLLAAPISEEVLFRGGVFNILRKVAPVPIACLLSSILFALIHGTMIHMVIGVFIAMYFCFVYICTRNLFVAIIAHAVYNAFAVFAVHFAIPSWIFQPCGMAIVCIFGSLFVVLLCTAIYCQIRKEYIS